MNAHIVADRFAKRHELDPADAIGWMLDERQREVGVDRRIAMSREMLAAGRNAVVLKAADNSGAEPRNGPGILAECSIADDGIARIGVNVEYGGVVEADPHGFELGGQRRREAARERLIAAASQRRHWRPFGERRTQTRDPPTFLIHRNPQRQPGRQ